MNPNQTLKAWEDEEADNEHKKILNEIERQGKKSRHLFSLMPKDVCLLLNIFFCGILIIAGIKTKFSNLKFNGISIEKIQVICISAVIFLFVCRTINHFKRHKINKKFKDVRYQTLSLCCIHILGYSLLLLAYQEYLPQKKPYFNNAKFNHIVRYLVPMIFFVILITASIIEFRTYCIHKKNNIVSQYTTHINDAIHRLLEAFGMISLVCIEFHTPSKMTTAIVIWTLAASIIILEIHQKITILTDSTKTIRELTEDDNKDPQDSDENRHPNSQDSDEENDTDSSDNSSSDNSSSDNSSSDNGYRL
jgi:predicted cation transporter